MDSAAPVEEPVEAVLVEDADLSRGYQHSAGMPRADERYSRRRRSSASRAARGARRITTRTGRRSDRRARERDPDRGAKGLAVPDGVGEVSARARGLDTGGGAVDERGVFA